MTSSEFKKFKRDLHDDEVESIIVFQRRPYTVAIVYITHEDKRYVDFGCAKVNWPDWWDYQFGEELAIGKAIHNIACAITGKDILPKRVVAHFPQTVGKPLEREKIDIDALFSEYTTLEILSNEIPMRQKGDKGHKRLMDYEL